LNKSRNSPPDVGVFPLILNNGNRNQGGKELKNSNEKGTDNSISWRWAVEDEPLHQQARRTHPESDRSSPPGVGEAFGERGF
jgi:hypothetical protein